MRIPLDYYRILSVPVKANEAQLNQAYSDRLQQQPRREYSAIAIEARQELIKRSYQVLSNSEQRAIYDAQFLLNMQPLETLESVEIDEMAAAEVAQPEIAEIDKVPTIPVANPTIEIEPELLVGALLILHELGEYETVLSIGIDYFNHRELESFSADDSGDTTSEDLVLTFALAYLELGREQWHRQEYENAAVSGKMGVELLQQKNLFPYLQDELERDLYRLRPYRILGLISQNPVQSEARASGFKLLQSMLLQRQGIEGQGEDRSGLNFDQFLCFIQQLRTYLTSAEQQQLFDTTSQSKSAIASYLAVYALLARGFCLKQPELVLRAQIKLDRLSEKQDVAWEQAVAALLLGHTEQAIDKLQQTPDPARLTAVQQHSASSSDLLPGLCFYGEQWLQQDVIAQFGDLSANKLTLKEYFAERQVQAYLDELTPATPTKTVNSNQAKTSANQVESPGVGIMSLWRNIFSQDKPKPVLASTRMTTASTANSQELVGAANARSSSSTATTSTATIERNQTMVFGSSTSAHSGDTSTGNYHNPRRKSPRLPMEPKANKRAVPSSVIKKTKGKTNRRVYRKKRSPATLWKGWLFILGLILGAGTIGNLGIRLFFTPEVKKVSPAPLAIALNQPPVTLPPKNKPPVAAKPSLNQQLRQVVQTWLNVKSAALGKEHQVEQFNSILAEPLLTTWRDRAQAYKQGNLHREYEHQITMRSAKINPQDQNQATIEAEVQEVAKHYLSGELDDSQSYDDNLLVRYQLIRQGDKWLIQETKVLESL